MMRTADLLLDGRRIEAGWWGEPPETAPSLALLHEGLGSLRLWGGFPALLARASGCGVFAFSRSGYGASDPVALPRPLDFMEREARDVLPRVLEAAGVERCLLVGHSDGASIAAIATGIRQDARLTGLVLMAPHFFVEDVSIAAIAAARDAYAAGICAPSSHRITPRSRSRFTAGMTPGSIRRSEAGTSPGTCRRSACRCC